MAVKEGVGGCCYSYVVYYQFVKKQEMDRTYFDIGTGSLRKPLRCFICQTTLYRRNLKCNEQTGQSYG